MKTNKLPQKKNHGLLLLLIFLFLTLLTIYGIKGAYTRYAQDDYCYGYRVKTLGFWPTQIQSYFKLTEYNSNRYSLNFFNSLTEVLGGPSFAPFIPALAMVAWFLALAYLFHQLFTFFYNPKDKWLLVFCSLAILFYILYLSPNLYQLLYWPADVNTYLTPVILTILIIGRLLAYSRAETFKWHGIAELGILCFIAGGFSETTAAWQFSIWMLALLGSIIFRKKMPVAQNSIKPLLTAVISTLLSLAILFVCPTNSMRASYYSRPDFQELIIKSLYFGEEFIRVSVKGKPLPYSIILCLGFWAGYHDMSKPKLRTSEYVFLLAGVLVILYLTVTASMTPTLYAMSSYPGDRALLPAHFSLVVALYSIGWTLSRAFSALTGDVKFNTIRLLLYSLLGILLLFYTARTAIHVYDKMPLYKARAEAWDLRQQIILDEKAAGKSDIIIPQFDSIYGITEIKPESNNWVNICAAKYYGVNSITAQENYMGIPAYPIGK